MPFYYLEGGKKKKVSKLEAQGSVLEAILSRRGNVSAEKEREKEA